MTRLRAFRFALGLGLAFGLAGCVEPPKTLEPEDGYPRERVDRRALVSEVSAVEVETTLTGVIIRATGTVSAAGYWNTELVYPAGVRDDIPPGDTLVLEFRAQAPREDDLGVAGGTNLQAVRYLPNKLIKGVRTVTIIGADNSLSTRR